jgi:hypothetical protein
VVTAADGSEAVGVASTDLCSLCSGGALDSGVILRMNVDCATTPGYKYFDCEYQAFTHNGPTFEEDTEMNTLVILRCGLQISAAAVRQSC